MRPAMIICAVAGVILGAAQAWLLGVFAKYITAGNYAASICICAVKLIAYAAVFSALVLTYKKGIIPLGIGAGTGIVLSAAVMSVKSIKK